MRYLCGLPYTGEETDSQTLKIIQSYEIKCKIKIYRVGYKIFHKNEQGLIINIPQHYRCNTISKINFYLLQL